MNTVNAGFFCFGNYLRVCRLRITGQVLAKLEQGVVCIVTVAVGAEVSRVAVLREEAEALAVGDRVSISAKSFNPDIKKLRID
jgi:hypothetical protein